MLDLVSQELKYLLSLSQIYRISQSLFIQKKNYNEKFSVMDFV